MGYNKRSIKKIVDNQKAYFNSNETLDVNFRIAQLKKLKQMLLDNEGKITEALKRDLNRAPFESYLCDIGPSLMEINEAIRCVKRWTKPETHFSGLLCFPSIFTKVYKMPYGTTLIISPYNFPLTLTISPLVAAIAGGNTAVLRTSTRTPHCSYIINQMISETFDPSYITVVDGGHDVADMLLEQKFDKIFYTGSPKIAKHILELAAKNITPVALELGGENGNWCVIRKDADIKDAARKIAFFKTLNAGQICININQIAVAEEIADEFISELKAQFVKQIVNKETYNEEYPRLISQSKYDECVNICSKYRSKIIFGGNGNEDKLTFSPTILYPIRINDALIKKELFSPILPIVSYKDEEIDTILNTISSREKPLAMYLFTQNIEWAKKTMQTLQYGGGGINEVCVHFLAKGAPFNGTGHSGIGAYHGKWGFNEFTHPQTVLFGSNKCNLSLREHPYTKFKLFLLKLFER